MPRQYDPEGMSFQEVVFYFSIAYITQTININRKISKRKISKEKNTKGPIGRANLFTLIFGKQPLL